MKKIFTKKDMIKLQDLLRKHKKTITTAESCTGGLVASMITKISGSSDIFNGAIVSYSNEVKHQELRVSSNILEKYGAVSKEVVHQMLNGALKKFNASFAIAISGVAGPKGGTKNKPVGTVIIGIANNLGAKKIKRFYFTGTRVEIQKKSAQTSLREILKFAQKTLDN